LLEHCRPRLGLPSTWRSSRHQCNRGVPLAPQTAPGSSYAILGAASATGGSLAAPDPLTARRSRGSSSGHYYGFP
jgi:hypothetical protein